MSSYSHMRVLIMCLSPRTSTFSILSQGNVESPCGQISQLEVCQLLSAGPQVVYPVGLNGDDQPATIDLPGPLHSGSSVTNDDPPYLKIHIPSPAPAEQTHADLPLGGVHTTPDVIMLKTPWKPRISLIDEVSMLLDRGMTEDYNHEPEHSAVAKEPNTKADASLPQLSEAPA